MESMYHTTSPTGFNNLFYTYVATKRVHSSNVLYALTLYVLIALQFERKVVTGYHHHHHFI